MTQVPIDIILLMLMSLGGMTLTGLVGYLIILQLGRPTKVGRRSI